MFFCILRLYVRHYFIYTRIDISLYVFINFLVVMVWYWLSRTMERVNLHPVARAWQQVITTCHLEEDHDCVPDQNWLSLKWPYSSTIWSSTTTGSWPIWIKHLPSPLSISPKAYQSEFNTTPSYSYTTRQEPMHEIKLSRKDTPYLSLRSQPLSLSYIYIYIYASWT